MCVCGAGRWWVYELQGVGSTFELRRVEGTSAAAAAAAAALAADGSGAAEGRFLFVGMNLNKAAIHQKLMTCVGPFDS